MTGRPRRTVEPETRVWVRVPKSVMEKVMALAEADRRSGNSEAIFLIEEAIRHRENPPKEN